MVVLGYAMKGVEKWGKEESVLDSPSGTRKEPSKDDGTSTKVADMDFHKVSEAKVDQLR